MEIRKRLVLAVLLVVSIVSMVGCEAIGGVNVADTVLSTLDKQSSEGAFQLEWSLDSASAPASAGTSKKQNENVLGKLIALGGKLSLQEWKSQDAGHASGQGTLSLAKGDIPLQLFLDGDRLIVQAEGAKKPYEFDIGSMELASSAIAGLGGSEGMAGLMKPGTEQYRELIKAIAAFALHNMPNPEKISSTEVTETIGGAEKTLTKISITLNAAEINALTAQLLRNAAKDEQAFRALIGSLYDIMQPTMAARLKESGSKDPLLRIAVSNRTLALQFLYSAMQPKLQELADNSAMEPTAGDGSSVTLDLLLDGQTQAGFDIGVVWVTASGKKDGTPALHIAASSRKWNIGAEVRAKQYTGETYKVKPDIKPRHRLDNVRKDSLLYEILKKDLKINTHSFVMQLNKGANDPLSPYVKGKGTTMVPLRYVSEELDTVVQWDGKTKTITVVDAEAKLKLVLKIGSKKATVNGVSSILPETPEQKSSTTFVPIAFITRALGGTAIWDSAGYVIITKEF